jgi:6-pyruvoyltetrahydropterin/6-carboxytetrahydropterin synthase
MNSDTTITCTRRFQFCAGHRVMGHENKCRHFHGHNYVAFVTVQASEDIAPLDELGRVIDFSVVKSNVGSWIDRHWDHGFIVFGQDYQAIKALEMMPERDQKLYILPTNPTAENMAAYLLEEICPMVLSDDVTATKVVLWETENCYATAET